MSGMGGSSAGSSGSPAEQCAVVAQATNASPVAIAIADSTALDSVRKAIDTRSSAENATQDATSQKLALFDKGVAAAREARTAKSAAAAGPSATVNDLREHRALGDLYQYGRTLGSSEPGMDAQAFALIVAVERFEDVNGLPKQLKSAAAEPLFSAILNVPTPAPTAGRATATWNEYLSAAARSVGATSAAGGTGHAIGGGPAGTDEKTNIREVAHSVEDRLQMMAQQLPASSPLRPQVDASITSMRSIEAQASTSSTTTPSGSKKTGTPKKQK
jgi:hypothetical protein